MIEVAPADPEGPEAKALLADYGADLATRYGNPEEAWSLSTLTVIPGKGAFFVARADGASAGCAGIRPLEGGERTAELKRLYVRPDFRRRGVARALVMAVEAEAARLGYQSLQLETGTLQPEAVALYEASGFARIAPYGEYKDSPTSLCFAKSLLPADAAHGQTLL